MRAGLGRGFEHAGAQPLAAHLHQPEAGDAADLDAGAVVLQRLLHRLLDLADMAVLLHVDEVDDDQAGHVAQAQLARDLVRRLEVGGEGGLLDIVLARRAARVDVDRDQGLGRVDDQIAARLQLDDRLVHRATAGPRRRSAGTAASVSVWSFTRRTWLGISSFMKPRAAL